MLPFAMPAAELRQQEFMRLKDAVVPRLEALQSMTPQPFGWVIAHLMEAFGHTILTDPATLEFITTKSQRKYVVGYARPTDAIPTGTPALHRLHDRIVADNAHRGFYVTSREFTPEAKEYAAGAPMDLIDGKLLVKALAQNRRIADLPSTYKAMCCECGNLVHHRLDAPESIPCAKGHLVAPTIAKAMLEPPVSPMAIADKQPRHRPRRAPRLKPRAR